MKKVLIISHPNFTNGLKIIASEIPGISADVISFKGNLFEKKSLFEKGRLLSNYDIVHFFWAYIRLFDLLYFKLFLRKRIINNFIGSDLYKILSEGGFRKRTELRLCSHLSEYAVTGGILKNELNELGINSVRVDFINSEIRKREYTYPSEKVAAVYLPSMSKDFYNFHFLLKLAENFPDVEFIWFPYKREMNEKLPGNITTVEYVEHEKIFSFFNEVRVFIRLPLHDGLPNTLIESLNIGRWAIWSSDHYGVSKAENYDELAEHFSILIEKEEPNIDAEKYVTEQYNLKKISWNFSELYKLNS